MVISLSEKVYGRMALDMQVKNDKVVGTKVARAEVGTKSVYGMRGKVVQYIRNIELKNSWSFGIDGTPPREYSSIWQAKG